MSMIKITVLILLLVTATLSLIYTFKYRKQFGLLEFIIYSVFSSWVCIFVIAEINVNIDPIKNSKLITTLISYIVAQYAIFKITKLKRDDIFNLRSLIKNTNSKTTGKPKMVDIEKIKSIVYNKWKKVGNNKTAICRVKSPFENYEVLLFIMKKDGEFGAKYHPDMVERCYITKGSFKDIISGQTYKVGDTAIWAKNKVHQPKALESTEGISYLRIL